MGDLDTASSYMQYLQLTGDNVRQNLDDKTLELQISAKSGLLVLCCLRWSCLHSVCILLENIGKSAVIFRRYCAGNVEETRKLLIEMSSKKDGIKPCIMAEAFSMACLAAWENGWRCDVVTIFRVLFNLELVSFKGEISALARESLEMMITKIVLCSSQQDVPELDVDKVNASPLTLPFPCTALDFRVPHALTEIT